MITNIEYRVSRIEYPASRKSMSKSVLAIETTTDISSIALIDDSRLLGEYNFAHDMNLSRRLMPNITSLMKDCNVTWQDIHGIGVSIGPGSFTGLRIGVTTAKTLAQTMDVSVVGIVSLDIMAHQFDCLPSTLVCPIIKVRKGEVYYAFYCTRSGDLERLSDYEAGTYDALAERACSLEGGSIIFAGDALDNALPALRSRLGDRVIPAPAHCSYPKASVLAVLARSRIELGEAQDAYSLMPFYIRKSAPEERASQ